MRRSFFMFLHHHHTPYAYPHPYQSITTYHHILSPPIALPPHIHTHSFTSFTTYPPQHPHPRVPRRQRLRPQKHLPRRAPGACQESHHLPHFPPARPEPAVRRWGCGGQWAGGDFHANAERGRARCGGCAYCYS
jgi:hypothetical protein